MTVRTIWDFRSAQLVETNTPAFRNFFDMELSRVPRRKKRG